MSQKLIRRTVRPGINARGTRKNMYMDPVADTKPYRMVTTQTTWSMATFTTRTVVIAMTTDRSLRQANLPDLPCFLWLIAAACLLFPGGLLILPVQVVLNNAGWSNSISETSRPCCGGEYAL
jgi:hypothetical protein